MNDSKRSGTFGVVVCYAAALAGAVGVVMLLDVISPVWRTFWADVVATVIVFVFSLFIRNASFYDPYWSVAPLPIALYWKYQIGSPEWQFREIILVAVVCCWSIRLTLNWYRGWQGIHHQDWRYTDLKRKTGVFYPLVNLLGIHLFPTILVFLGCLPMTGFFSGPAQYAYAASNVSKALFGLGAIAGFIAPVIQWFADEQMRRHRRRSLRTHIDAGLWKYSRHPNYFGEILFWISLALMGCTSDEFAWWMLAGVAAMILLFVFVSIPMMEKHLLHRYPEYQNYRETVSMLVPWFRKA